MREFESLLFVRDYENIGGKKRVTLETRDGTEVIDMLRASTGYFAKYFMPDSAEKITGLKRKVIDDLYYTERVISIKFRGRIERIVGNR